MEKKTIGKFISALRRASGMTQRELGEKLFVSDKTISRWECDESVPDLALIPLIAEIFGISTDELLRGERNSSTDADSEKCERNRQSSERKMRLMLSNRKKKYKNQLLASVGISLIGLLAAIMIDLAFSKGLIAFCVSGALFIIGELLAVGFSANATVELTDDDTCSDDIDRYNNEVKRYALVLTLLNICLVAFCLPLVTVIDGRNFGLLFGSWLGFGSVFTFVAAVLCYSAYIFLLKGRVFKLTEREAHILKCVRRVYAKCFCVGLCVAILLGVGIGAWNNLIGFESLIKEQVFYNADDFRTQMRIDYKNWYNEGYSRGDSELPSNDYGKVSKTVYGKDGEYLFEFYYHPQLYHSIEFTESASDKMPVRVVTLDAYYDACDVFDTVNIILLALLVCDPIVCVVIYINKLNKIRSKEE